MSANNNDKSGEIICQESGGGEIVAKIFVEVVAQVGSLASYVVVVIFIEIAECEFSFDRRVKGESSALFLFISVHR